MYKEDQISSIPCGKREFGGDEFGNELLATWVNANYQYDLFCPDLANTNLTLHNQKGAMQSQSIKFRIEMCNQNNGNGCKSKEVISEFVKELQVQFWITDSSIDMRFFHNESLTRN